MSALGIVGNSGSSVEYLDGGFQIYSDTVGRSPSFTTGRDVPKVCGRE